jgi:diguanylate cyclase (GGDEF)-like protein/PAS domain S-box-containing protein
VPTGRAAMMSVLLIEASPTRQHVLRRVLAGRFPDVTTCGTHAEAVNLLRDARHVRPAAIVLGLETIPERHTDDLLSLLRAPMHRDIAVLILARIAEPATVDWAARRVRSAVLLWEDFTDAAECLDKLLAPARASETEPPVADVQPVRVLFVDDSRTVRASYRRLLTTQGYVVEVAANAVEAMEKARHKSFDIAIIDYFMPGENGDVLCRRLRADARTASVTAAILTGTYLDQVIQDSLKAGAVECMFKNEAQELFLARLAAMSRSVRDSKSSEAERRRLAGILSSVGDGVYGVNRAGQITFINPAARRILGYSEKDALIGRAAHALFHHAGEDGAPNPAETCSLQEAYAHGDELNSWETVFWHKAGAPVPVECTVFPMRIDEHLEGSVVAFRDVSERRALEQELVWQVNHDPLTKLCNRHSFEKHLDEEVARVRRGQNLSALLYLDLDRFKYINDTAGHAAGDQLLVEIGQQLRERLREADLLARIGGDEFALILRNVSGEHVLLAAENFREVLERYTFVYGGQQYKIYGSIGVAPIDQGTRSSGEVLANADIACHVAKNKGRNQTHIYEPGNDAKIAMNLDLGWSTRLRRALKSDGFVLHYQAIVPLAGLTGTTLPQQRDPFLDYCAKRLAEGNMAYCEALVRLMDSDVGLTNPTSFLPTAERFGLMPQIDLWVTRQVITRLAGLHRDGKMACVSINLSGHTFDNEYFVPEVKRLLVENGVDPRLLIFEITETNAIANIEAAKRLIGELRALGCRFALDDFGSGFSSFHHLKHLPVDFVKIDGQFVRGMVRDAADRAIVVSINDIAHSLGKRTVAEFVESREILEMLCHVGVDYAQGNFLSAPQPEITPSG